MWTLRVWRVYQEESTMSCHMGPGHRVQVLGRGVLQAALGILVLYVGHSNMGNLSLVFLLVDKQLSLAICPRVQSLIPIQKVG
jgi:hypothetical protein